LVVVRPGTELGDDVVAVDQLHRMLLEAPDPVVADDPDDVGAEPNERVEVPEREPQRAVAPHHDDLPPGMREGGGERVPAPRAEAAVRPGVEEAAGLVRVDVLAGVRHEVAAVADDDRVAAEPAPEPAVGARRPDRRPFSTQRDRFAVAAPVLPLAYPPPPRT